MENLFIAKVRKIAKNAKGETINIVVIDTTNNKPSIIRTFTQFITDLKDSDLIDDTVNNINHPQISGRSGVLRGLRRGEVYGDITYTNKGDKFLVTEDSGVIKDPSHPEFGQWSIGDERVATESKAIVEGFLTLDTNERFDMVHATATARVSAEGALKGAFEDFSAVEEVVEEVVDTVPNKVLAEVLGNEKPTAKKK